MPYWFNNAAAILLLFFFFVVVTRSCNVANFGRVISRDRSFKDAKALSLTTKARFPWAPVSYYTPSPNRALQTDAPAPKQIKVIDCKCDLPPSFLDDLYVKAIVIDNSCGPTFSNNTQRVPCGCRLILTCQSGFQIVRSNVELTCSKVDEWKPSLNQLTNVCIEGGVCNVPKFATTVDLKAGVAGTSCSLLPGAEFQPIGCAVQAGCTHGFVVPLGAKSFHEGAIFRCTALRAWRPPLWSWSIECTNGCRVSKDYANARVSNYDSCRTKTPYESAGCSFTAICNSGFNLLGVVPFENVTTGTTGLIRTAAQSQTYTCTSLKEGAVMEWRPYFPFNEPDFACHCICTKPSVEALGLGIQIEFDMTTCSTELPYTNASDDASLVSGCGCSFVVTCGRLPDGRPMSLADTHGNLLSTPMRYRCVDSAWEPSLATLAASKCIANSCEVPTKLLNVELTASSGCSLQAGMNLKGHQPLGCAVQATCQHSFVASEGVPTWFKAGKSIHTCSTDLGVWEPPLNSKHIKCGCLCAKLPALPSGIRVDYEGERCSGSTWSDDFVGCGCSMIVKCIGIWETLTRVRHRRLRSSRFTDEQGLIFEDTAMPTRYNCINSAWDPSMNELLNEAKCIAVPCEVPRAPPNMQWTAAGPGCAMADGDTWAMAERQPVGCQMNSACQISHTFMPPFASETFTCLQGPKNEAGQWDKSFPQIALCECGCLIPNITGRSDIELFANAWMGLPLSGEWIPCDVSVDVNCKFGLPDSFQQQKLIRSYRCFDSDWAPLWTPLSTPVCDCCVVPENVDSRLVGALEGAERYANDPNRNFEGETVNITFAQVHGKCLPTLSAYQLSCGGMIASVRRVLCRQNHSWSVDLKDIKCTIL